MLSLWGTMYSVLYTGIRTCTLEGYYLETGTKSWQAKQNEIGTRVRKEVGINVR